MRCASLGFSAALLAIFGCTSIAVDYQRLPTPEALGSIRPGVTTRSEVLRRLGPPEEMRRPAPFERTRLTSPQRRRILESGDVFGRNAYTYSSERDTRTGIGLLPNGPALLRISWRSLREDRWRLEFDEKDVVRSVSHVDESADDGR
jgi:hypothetical protein